jgi:hypothetical protein
MNTQSDALDSERWRGIERPYMYVVSLNGTLRSDFRETVLSEWPRDAACVDSPASVVAAFGV